MHLPFRFTPRLLLCWLAATPAAALPPGCDTFTWNVSRELAALQTPPTPIDAGTGPDTITRIEPNTRYNARLHPQASVTLAAHPGKPMLDDDARAGMLTFQVPHDGHYRASITSGHWIDMVDNGQIVRSLDFQGRQTCPLVHKIVEYDLRAGRDLVLQFAGGNAAEVGVVITAVEPVETSP